jgi:predicted amidohydrolase
MACPIVFSADIFLDKPLSPEENFAKATAYIRLAASQGSQLAVLPEYHLTSWVPEHPDFVASSVESVAYLPRYQALAREINIHIVPGTIVEPVEQVPSATPERSIGDETETSNPPVTKLRNVAYFIAASTGDILSTYQKKNLWYLERGILMAGRHAPHKAFDVPLPGNGTVRVGMLICWDLAFPEAFRELVADGAQVIVIPSYWHITKINSKVLALNLKSEVVFLDSMTVARAYENTCVVAFCNAWGESQVAMPILGTLGKLGVEKDDMIVGEVDLDVLRVAEDHYKVRADLQGEGWHYSHCVTQTSK